MEYKDLPVWIVGLITVAGFFFLIMDFFVKSDDEEIIVRKNPVVRPVYSNYDSEEYDSNMGLADNAFYTDELDSLS